METWSIFHRNKRLADVRVHKTLFAKLRGLMFALPLKKQEGIILVSNEENLAAIHMLFVFFPIDVLWLDTKGVVISKAACVQPFTLAVTPPKKARYIVELEAGAAKRIWKNDVIIIKK